jgi:hypothetical protein
MVVGALNPFIRKGLARRLSLLNYLEHEPSAQGGILDDNSKQNKAA